MASLIILSVAASILLVSWLVEKITGKPLAHFLRKIINWFEED